MGINYEYQCDVCLKKEKLKEFEYKPPLKWGSIGVTTDGIDTHRMTCEECTDRVLEFLTINRPLKRR